MRHSPLTAISPANAAQLGRAYTVDFKKLDPGIKIGEQSYPVAIDGQLYVTTNDDNVFRIDGATGKVVWQFKPSDSGVFKNFGIVANRGVTYCDGKLFLLTLDMHINALSPADGHLIKRVTIAHDVPGAGSNYGYSETSTPTCANHRLVFGAAGSEYGTRGFVMAYTTDLTPAWPSPYWTIPPEQQSWRAASRIIGGGNVWTPVTIDASTNTVYFGTGSATPLYFPSVRPGPNPRTDSLIAVDLQTGQTKWWQQLITGNQWAYDVSQPPLVYDGKVGGKTQHVVSVASMEGVWFAFDAATGKPFHQRVKVVDRVEHPSLQPGKPVTVYPSSIGGLNYSPASYDPSTNYVFNAAAETAAQLVQQELTPAQKRNKFILGACSSACRTAPSDRSSPAGTTMARSAPSTCRRAGASGSSPRPSRSAEGWPRRLPASASRAEVTGCCAHSISRPEPSSGRSRPARRSPRGRPCSRSARRNTSPSPSAARRRLRAAARRRSSRSSRSEVRRPRRRRPSSRRWCRARRGARTPIRSRVTSRGPPRTPAPTRASSAGAGRIVTQSGLFIQEWDAASQNSEIVTGHVLLRGKPVSGVGIRVGNYPLRTLTDSSGKFSYRVDTTLPRRHVASVASVKRAKLDGRALSSADQAAVLGLHNGFSVGYQISGLHTSRGSGGNVVLTGRAVFASGKAVPPVALYTYQLSGTVTDSSGKPVYGAVVVSRTQDRDFWTFSKPTDRNGHYTSFFAASDELGDDPVALSVQVASGSVSFSSGATATVKFSALKSAALDIKLPSTPTGVMALPTPSSYEGAIYEGLVLGVSGAHGMIRPLSASWPDRNGRFRLTLPASARGQKLQVWEALGQFFSSFPATPGGRFDMKSYPAQMLQRYPQGMASIVAT